MSKGKAFLLKFGDDAEPMQYRTVAGMRTSQMTYEPQHVSLTAHGIFIGQGAEREVRAAALSGEVKPCQLSFENGDKMTGSFLITRLDYAGRYNGEESYSITVESAGAPECVLYD